MRTQRFSRQMGLGLAAIAVLVGSAPGGEVGAIAGGVYGIALGVGEEPLVGAGVGLFSGDTLLDVVVTDAGGEYFFDALPAGEYGVYVFANGFESQADVVQVFAGEASFRYFELGSLSACPECPFQNVTEDRGLIDYIAGSGDGHGPGAVFTDLTGDGYPDLYLMRAADKSAAGAANQLYVNVRGPGGRRHFVRAPHDAGAGDTGNATGAVAADYDNDGDLDLYVNNFDQPNALLQNQLAQTGRLRFIDVTAGTDPTPGVDDDQFGVGIAFFEGVPLDNSLTAAWADVDRDGLLDLYVGNHNGYSGGPVEGPFSVPGRRDVLYHNNGNGTFTDITMSAGAPGYISEAGKFTTAEQRFSSTNAVVFADFNNDRWPDLLVTNKIGGPTDRDMLYINRGAAADGHWRGFATVTYALSPPFGFASGAAMGVDVADMDNDGDLDIYITDFSGPFGTPGQNDLWVNQLSQTGALGFALSEDLPAIFSWGTQLQDFNNDGLTDIHVATAGTNRDYFYLNTGTDFAEVGVLAGVAQVRYARGDLSADFNRDGWLDLFVVNLSENPALYRNDLAGAFPDNHYLTLELTGDPDAPEPYYSSRDAIGARAQVTADLNGDGFLTEGETQTREVVSGNSNAASTSSLALEFGLGLGDGALVEIDWPSGRQSHYNLAADQTIAIHETLGINGDLDGDGCVTLGDLAILLSNFGQPGGPADGDLDANGDVDLSDLSIMLSVFGRICP